MSEVLNEAHKLVSEGWNALNAKGDNKQRQQQAEEQFEFARAIAAVFVGGKGKHALENLKKQFQEPPTWSPHVTNVSDTTAYGFIREGQKSVIKFIENCLLRVEQGPPNASQE